ncbi:hypothetical protein PAMP_022467 [Pampus punctatissimus]
MSKDITSAGGEKMESVTGFKGNGDTQHRKKCECLVSLEWTSLWIEMDLRWEMQDGAELEDGEKTMVEDLQRVYFVCHCSPGQQDPPEADETVVEQTHGRPQTSDKSAAQ